jgi:cytochrome c oxidase assembly protein subunit 15
MAHAAIATCFVGLVAATFIILESVGAPERLRNAAKRLLIVSCIQGAIGFIQYATHLPAWLVEIHVLGAVSLTMGVTSFQLSQVARDKETWAIKTPSAVPA